MVEDNQADVYLDLQGVGKSFGTFTALHEISLRIREGQFVCFVGPSGCGKTTLLRLIAGLETPDHGRIVQQGQDVTSLPPAARDFGIVFQSYALFPNLTSARNVAYGLHGKGQSKPEISQRVQDMLTLVGLPDQERKFPSQLSGGQQQRVALARALAPKPGLLLLDEPLSALDAKERERLRLEIREVQHRLGVTTVMVTHDQEEALAMADTIVVMNAGRIEQIGTPADVYQTPSTPFVADFIGETNWIDAVAEGPDQARLGTHVISSQNHGLSKGDKMRLALRPEDLNFCPLVEKPVGLQARISEISFRGPVLQVQLSLEAQSSVLQARAPATAVGEGSLQIGDQVDVTVTPGRAQGFAV